MWRDSGACPTEALCEGGRKAEGLADHCRGACPRGGGTPWGLGGGRLLLIGRLDEAERTLAELPSSRQALRRARDARSFPLSLLTVHELVVAGIAIRRLRTKAAGAALARAESAARHAGIPALTAEVDSAVLVLKTPAARLIAKGEERPLLLEEVETL